MIDQLLEKVGLKYEDLNPVEKETLHTWEEALRKGQVSIETIREYIDSMKDAVESELCKTDLGTKQDILLKARLRNYMLLRAFLTTPEKIKEQMEGMMSGIANKG